MREEAPILDKAKLRSEIFSILENKFLFGSCDEDHRKQLASASVSPSDEASSLTSPTATEAVRNERGKVCVLAIDGGGMRNLISGKALAYLEQALKKKSGNPDARIADYFDVAAGTGVGGIFTSMLFATKDGLRPICTADETWKMLTENGKSIYGCRESRGFGLINRKKLVGGGLEKMMNERFRVLTLKDTLKPVLIPCYDLSTSAPFLFSRADALETNSFDFRLSDICCATSADPGVLGVKLMKSVDGRTNCLAVGGGVAMSNPTAAAITHVLHNKQEFPFVRGVEDILVLSLGTTGQVVEKRYEFDQVRKWKDVDWVRPMARVSSDSSAEIVDQSVSMAFGQCRSSNYVRIQANGSNLGQCVGNVDTDSSSSNVKKLTEMAEEMLKQKNVESVLFEGKRVGEKSNYEKLDWFAGELVMEHQRRSCRIAPTVAFKQVQPKPSS